MAHHVLLHPHESASALRLWGLHNRALDHVLTLTTAGIVLASRVLVLASGPWEWDETIFARGMLHFELAAHFPHPPGFPGLLALGHLLLPLAGEPYRALQLVSALAAVLALWPLAALGRRVAHPAVAVAAAVLVIYLPGPWLYSLRGFSSMAAVALALAAAAMIPKGLDGRRHTWFTLLLTAAFLVRPILLPTIGLLWLFGLHTVNTQRRVLPGLTLGAGLVAVAVAVMVHLEGGWAAFVTPFVAHAGFHAARLHHNTRLLADVGLIKGVGGMAAAAAVTLTSMVGLAVWFRRVGRRAAFAWAAILILTTAQLLMLQNRSYARYAVGVQMAVAPLIAGAASLVAPPAAVVGLLGVAGFSAWSTWPLVREQHTETFGPWKATVDAAERAAERGWAVVVEPEVHVFSSYWWHVLAARGEEPPPMVLSPRAPEAWVGVDRPWVVATVHPELYWKSLTHEVATYGGVSDRLRPLTQNRFLSAAVIDNPPLPIGEWWTLEYLGDGRPFMWAGPGAELWLPPSPTGTVIGLEVRPAPGASPLIVAIDHGGGSFELDGGAPARRLWTRTTEAGDERPIIVRLQRSEAYPPGGGDDRQLATQLLDVVVRPPGVAWGGPVSSREERETLDIEVDGAYEAEDFPRLGRGVWLQPVARLRVPLHEAGRIELRLAAPRPTPANPRILVEGLMIGGPFAVASSETAVEVVIGEPSATDGLTELVVVSDAYRPATTGGGTDTRELGVVLLGVRFTPASLSDGWWSVRDGAENSSH